MINSFTGKYEFLSNFYAIDIIYKNITYKSSEHAYQASKALNKKDHDLIMNAKTPGKAKRLGKKIKLSKTWNKDKFFIMYEIVKSKFAQHPDLMKLLLETKNEELIEGNNWNDTYWGICDGTGTNYLGKILMQIRSGVNIF